MAKQDVWSTAKKEINAITSNARKIIGLSETDDPSDKRLFSIFFGEESNFAKAIMSKLEVDYQLLLEWLHDSFLQAIYQMAPSNLYNDKIIKSHLMLNEGGNYGI